MCSEEAALVAIAALQHERRPLLLLTVLHGAAARLLQLLLLRITAAGAVGCGVCHSHPAGLKNGASPARQQRATMVASRTAPTFGVGVLGWFC
jgi:hypothetical protein